MPGAGSAAFARDAFAASTLLRRLPNDLKRVVKTEVRTLVAGPLAAKMGSAVTGPHAARIRPAVKATTDTVPRIKIGGARKVVSGGASVRQLVYGTEWGGGRRQGTVRSGRRSKAHRRATTAQFRGPRPFVYSTVRREQAWMLTAYGEVLDRALQGWRSG